MKKLCFGTLFTLLYLIRNKGNQPELYNYLVKPEAMALRPDSESFPAPSDVSNRKKGILDIPEADKSYFTDDSVSFEHLVMLYRSNLSPYLKDTNVRKAFVVAIKDVLREDVTIGDNDDIGSKGYTKNEILSKTMFDLFILIANLMKYCATIDNGNCKDEVKEIGSSFITDRLSQASAIILENRSFEVKTPLTITIDDKLFQSTFEELNADRYSIGLLNPNKVKIYKLQVRNKTFDYYKLSTFIRMNLARYVYSRSKRKDIESRENAESIAIQAVFDLAKSKYSNNADNFCELMLYAFLEHCLNAPKILSGYEVDKTSLNSKSAGVYLLPAGAVTSNNQIVFGCSKAHSTIQDAVDDVLAQARAIIDNRDEEIRLLDPTILSANLEPEVASYVKNIIMPSKAGTSEPDDAFGIFLSYTIDVPNKDILDLVAYRTELDKKMDEDITNVLAYMKSKIDALGLSDYSFYFFVLPLNDATADAKSILSPFTGGGGDD